MKNGTTTSSRNAAISPYSSDIARILLGNIHGRADAPHPALAGCAHAVSGHVAAVHLAARVEASRRNCVPESQIILYTRGVMPSWRIVFSTFRDCMSFYTA